MCNIHTMAYYSAIKSNEELINATTRMNHENMLNERRQTQMITYYSIPLI